ncbi:MAG: flagellar basal body P-ring protein FlgI [Planctomycetes bacterium]|nr:flagellar basal body P-ring protein FlgI [Planctomycetota bacterium]
MKKLNFRLLLALILPPAYGKEIKELVTVLGVQENEITGVGLVMGLVGTGDKKNQIKEQMVKDWIYNQGLNIPPDVVIDSKNTAMVQVSGRLQAFSSKGQQIELKVSTLGDAKSLKNGILQFSQLSYSGDTSPQRTIFATAQGAIEILSGQPETSGIVRGIIQDTVPSNVVQGNFVYLLLNRPDHTDASRIVRAINQKFLRQAGTNIARALNAGRIEVTIPKPMQKDPVDFISQMEKVPILFTDTVARVRINTKTSMITLNGQVEVEPFAVSVGDMSIEVGGNKAIPNAELLHFPAETSDLATIIKALNDMGAKPRELVEIIKEIHKLGVMQGELIID